MKTVHKIKEITKEEIISGKDTKPFLQKSLYTIMRKNKLRQQIVVGV